MPGWPGAGQRAWPAVLVLEDGTTFHGTGFGAHGEAFGEMVFNTGMTGYQETLTDPSYCRQIVAMTAPHIGNTGVNDDDRESRRIWVSGYVVRDPSRIASSWRARRSLDEELAAHGVPGIAITGTRALTRRLRDRGVMRAAISAGPAGPAELLQRVLASPEMAGADLAREVSTAEPYQVSPPPGTQIRYRVAAVDLGIKAATPAAMAARGCLVQVLPATATAAEILAAGPDGAFFSNGPGDPAAAGYAVEAMLGLLAAGVPVFGICLGSQILGRALGLGTYKLRFGHRGVNQPVKDLATGRVQITSHNHGFAVAPPGAGNRPGAGAPEASPGHAPAAERAGHALSVLQDQQAYAPFDTPFGRAQVSHVNLNDGVVEGIRLLDAPAFGVQYHPEAAPGPHDAAGEFDAFCAVMERRRAPSGGGRRAGAGAERGRAPSGGGREARGRDQQGAGQAGRARHAQA
jgi:carbamoyl-phosphate synthase small subunit